VDKCCCNKVGDEQTIPVLDPDSMVSPDHWPDQRVIAINKIESGEVPPPTGTTAGGAPLQNILGLTPTEAPQPTTAQPAVATEFNVSLEKGKTDTLGLQVFLGDNNSLKITRIHDTGVASKWNTANPNQTMQSGDRIIEINGKRGDANTLMTLVQGTGKLDMVLTRCPPVEFTVTLKKGTGSPQDVVGADVDLTEKEQIKIIRIRDGLMNEWNKANPAKQVKAGDCILSINGKKSDNRAMMEVLRMDDQIEMVVAST